MEYYLSDKNLKKDVFFRKQIEQHEDGYIKLNLFLNCNNIKKMAVSEGEIANAINNS